MMASPAGGRSAIGLAMSVAVAAALTGWWQVRVFRTHGAEVKTEPWDRVKADYPPVQEAADAARLSQELVDTVLRANPFSPQRRVVPVAPSGKTADAAGGLVEPGKPTFAYKGRINLGKRQRAIVEELSAHKTYFLEVGQEVAGFKVLDIAENRVVLSDLQTKEEVVVSLATTAGP